MKTSDPRLAPRRFKPHTHHQMVWVKTSPFDKEWARDSEYYIPPAPLEVYFRVRSIFNNPRRLLEVSLVAVTLDRGVSFVDGRHRFAMLRDFGMSPIPVCMLSGEDFRNAEALGRLILSPAY